MPAALSCPWGTCMPGWGTGSAVHGQGAQKVWKAPRSTSRPCSSAQSEGRGRRAQQHTPAGSGRGLRPQTPLRLAFTPHAGPIGELVNSSFFQPFPFLQEAILEQSKGHRLWLVRLGWNPGLSSGVSLVPGMPSTCSFLKMVQEEEHSPAPYRP